AGHHRRREPFDGLRRRPTRRAATVGFGGRKRPGLGRGASAHGLRRVAGVAGLKRNPVEIALNHLAAILVVLTKQRWRRWLSAEEGDDEGSRSAGHPG